MSADIYWPVAVFTGAIAAIVAILGLIAWADWAEADRWQKRAAARRALALMAFAPVAGLGWPVVIPLLLAYWFIRLVVSLVRDAR